MRTLIAIGILLALAAGVSAESIEDQILDSPNDHAIVAVQWFGTNDNPILWYADVQAFLQADLPQIDYLYAKLNRVETGERLYVFTDSGARRRADVWLVDGQRVLFVYDDKRLPGVYEVIDPNQPFYVAVPWHGAGDAFILPVVPVDA